MDVLASVRIQAQFDILDEDGMIIAINAARNVPSGIDAMHRFELTTCYRLASGASGVVRSDVLVTSQSAMPATPMARRETMRETWLP